MCLKSYYIYFSFVLNMLSIEMAPIRTSGQRPESDLENERKILITNVTRRPHCHCAFNQCEIGAG